MWLSQSTGDNGQWDKGGRVNQEEEAEGGVRGERGRVQTPDNASPPIVWKTETPGHKYYRGVLLYVASHEHLLTCLPFH